MPSITTTATNPDWQDDLFGDAFTEAMTESDKPKAKRKADPAMGPVLSAWFKSQSVKDQAVLTAAGWTDASDSVAIPCRLVSADRPTLPMPAVRPAKDGKVRSSHLYDPQTLKRLREESRASGVARFNICCAVAATFSRTGKPIAIVDLAALVASVNLKESQTEVITMIARRLNLPMAVENGMITPQAKIPAVKSHEKYALAFNKAVSRAKSMVG